jgi:hypothetical protein
MNTPRRRKPAARPAARRRTAPARDFWGTDALDDPPDTVIRPTDQPTALIKSLGPPPFPGGEVARHYFDAVYERAAALAIALATSAGLADLEPADVGAEPGENR